MNVERKSASDSVATNVQIDLQARSANAKMGEHLYTGINQFALVLLYHHYPEACIAGGIMGTAAGALSRITSQAPISQQIAKAFGHSSTTQKMLNTAALFTAIKVAPFVGMAYPLAFYHSFRMMNDLVSDSFNPKANFGGATC